jgi:hypothetical protein
MTTEQTAQPTQEQRLPNNPLANKVLQAIRNAGTKGLNDLQLEWIFGRNRMAPERDKILRQLEGLNVIKCSPSRGGARLWIAIYPERNKGDKK